MPKLLRPLICLLTLFLGSIGQQLWSQVPLDSLERMYSRTRYVQFLGKTEKELKAIPKQDRPDLAVEQDFLRTLDPALGRPATERLVAARAYADLLRAQESVPGDANNAWVERGPMNVGGRTRALVWDPASIASGGNKVWAGGVTGGLWFNNNITNSGSTWQSAGNAWDNIAISAMSFDPTNPLVAYVGTGEGWFTASSRGAGVWKTTDGGLTWTQLASTTGFYYVNDLVVRNEGGVGVLYLAVDASYYAGQWSPGLSNYGLYRSTNGGASWSKVSLPTNSQAVSDLELDADNTLWAGTRRSPYSSTSGAQIIKSTNGTSWTLIYTQTPPISGGRTELAVGGSGMGLRVYAVFDSSNTAFNFIKSSNGGTSWTNGTLPVDADLGIGADFTRGQAWYDLILQVDPNNADVVYAGGIDLFRSTNGGSNWTQISKWSNNNNLAALPCPRVHADQHAITFRPGSSSTVLFGNDGGVFYSANITSAATTSTAISARNTGYNVTQFYSCAMHPASGSNNFLAGAQDNGTQRYTSVGVNSTTEVLSGDGAYCFIDQTNGSYQIGSYVYNKFYRSTNGGSNFSTLMSANTGDFINPAAYDSENNILFTKINGTNIYRVSGIQTTPTAPVSVTITNTSGSISHIKVSPYAPAGTTTLYIGSTDGRVLRVPNAHTGTTVVGTVIASSLAAGSVSCIELGSNENTLLVTFTNYGVNSVWMTTDGGINWVSKEGNLPDMPIRWALIHPTNPNEALLATELGTWATINLMASPPTWVPSNSGLANVRVNMLQYRTSDKMVAAATYGRGLFTSNAFAQTPSVQAGFYVDNAAPCQGSTVLLLDTSLGNPTSWNWTITPTGANFVNSTSSSSQNPQVQFSSPGVYTVRLIASNNLSSDSAIQTSVVSVGQIGLPFAEDFENASNRARWSVINPDNATTWTFATGVINSMGTNSAFIDNWNYSTTGQRDGLVSPPISLATASNASLSFRHAYRPFDNSTTYSDSMAVFVSTNCGATWTRIASYKETNLSSGGTYTWNTGPGLSSALFVPSVANEWCGTTIGTNTYAPCKSVDLSAYAGQEIRIKFENINSYGQGFYLDDIQLSAFSVTPPLASFTSSAGTICSGSTVSFTNTSTGSLTSYSWSVSPGTITYVSGNASSASPSIQFNAPGTYTVQLTATNAGGSHSATATITVNTLPAAPSGSASQTFCNSGTVASLTATGTGIQWYSASTGGTALSTSTALTNGTTYYASQTVSGCESATRLAVTAT
ncbi:MAG: PKD domain-containing protein, partial [Schleiferiaceae bacterium]|nr:PKD domain-containing protein [Schleiferiaceae bacterium]